MLMQFYGMDHAARAAAGTCEGTSLIVKELDPRYSSYYEMIQRGESMSDHREPQMYPLEEALRAQKALRDLAGLAPEQFPLQAFIGMVSDEIEILRQQGHSDEEIAETISRSSTIRITSEQIGANYAPAEQRRQAHG